MSKKENRSREIQGQKFERTLTFNRAKDIISEEDRTVQVAFSSEEPVERWYGMEILDHSKASVDLTRLQNAGPVLMDHDSRDVVAVIVSATVDSDRIGRATIRFGQSDRASEIFTDVLDGIRSTLSVGYLTERIVLEEDNEDSPSVYRATKWQPYEITFTSVPADATVGVGRSADEVSKGAEPKPIIEERTMKDEKKVEAAPAVDTQKIASDARASELSRIREIEAIGDKLGMKDEARSLIDNGASVEDMRAAAIEKLTERGAIKPITSESADIGMTSAETKRYSLMKIMRAKANPDNKRFAEEAAFELEASDAAAAKSGLEARGFVMPTDIGRRALTVSSAASAGNLVAEDYREESFIELLRNSLKVRELGATVLEGLQGNVTIPKHSGTTPAAAWIDPENSNAVELTQSVSQVLMTPKTVGAFTEYSRQLMLQSSIDVEAFVMRDLAANLATVIDLGALMGDGTNGAPTGIINFTDLNVPTKFASAKPTYDEMVEMETLVGADNAGIGSAAYLTSSKVRGALKTSRIDAGSGLMVWSNGEVNGYRAEASNQVSSTNNDVFYGHFGQLLLGFFGGVDILVDPYSNSKTGAIRVVAFQSVDVASRHDESFAWNDSVHV